MNLLKCSKCGEMKPPDSFHKKGGKYGKRTRSYICKHCQAKYTKKWRAKNADKIKQKRKEYHIKNADRINEKSKIWRQSNPERLNEQSRNWYNANIDRARKKERKKDKKYTENLQKCYVNKLLRRQSIPVNPDTVEKKKILIKLKRFIKLIEDETKRH